MGRVKLNRLEFELEKSCFRLGEQSLLIKANLLISVLDDIHLWRLVDPKRNMCNALPLWLRTTPRATFLYVTIQWHQLYIESVI